MALITIWRQRNEARMFSRLCIGGIALLIALAAMLVPEARTTIEHTNKDAAKDALGFLKETTTWMASIQTATIAALGFLAKDGMTNFRPTQKQLNLAILVALLNSVALFFSAWILTSLPSLMLRVGIENTNKFDFFNFPIYYSLNGTPFGGIFTVHFFAFCNHWLWACSVVAFGWLCISMAISRSERGNAEVPI